MSTLPDRIDFILLDDGRITVLKMRREVAERRDIVTNHDVHLDLDLDAALAWCDEHGYTIRTWDGGARAWHGEMWVIRTASQIKRERERLERRSRALLRRSPDSPASITMLDLAYDG